MKSNVLSKLKQCLNDSSRIVSDSRVSSSLNQDINLFESLQKRQGGTSQYIDRLSFNHSYNSHEQSDILKKVPLLVSQNDQLKQKIKGLEEQLERDKKDSNNSKRNTFSFQQQNNRYATQPQADELQNMNSLHKSVDKQTNITKSVQSSLSHVHRKATNKSQSSHSQRRTNRFDFQKKNEELQRLRESVKQLQYQNYMLKRNNVDLQSKYQKMIQNKQKNQHQIDQIVRCFSDTLRKKDQLQQKQTRIMEEKINQAINQFISSQQQLQHLKTQNKVLRQKLSEMHNTEIQNRQLSYLIDQMRNGVQYCQNIQKPNRQSYIRTQGIDHLWKIKQIEYDNIFNILGNLKHISNNR